MKNYIIPMFLFLLIIAIFCVAGYVDCSNSEKLKLDSENKSFNAGYKAGQLDAMNNVWKYKKIDGKIFKQDL